ncbi:MAG: hypothetical protein MK086_14825 [Flavobacteriales bacterium]|nr:hypothetical protein [Flavobacteriales bacterium]
MMKYLIFIGLVLLGTDAYASAEAKKLYQELKTAFYWASGIGIFIGLGVIAAAWKWPDSWVSVMAQKYKVSLGWAALAFIAFVAFQQPIAKWVTWMRDPAKDVLKMDGK